MSNENKNVLLAALQQSVQQAKVKLSNGKKITVRAFLVKEMKMLMLANESNQSIEDTIIQIVKNCILTEDVDVDTLPIFDLEAIYLALYKLSKASPYIPAMFTCANEILDETGNIQYDEFNNVVKCGNEIKVNINLNNAKLSDPPSNKVKLNEQISVIMRYPTVHEMEYFNIRKESDLFNLINRCISEVELPDGVVKVGVDIPFEDISEVMEYADESALSKMSEFVTGIPQHTIDIPVVCKKCGHKEVVNMVGIHSFFG